MVFLHYLLPTWPRKKNENKYDFDYIELHTFEENNKTHNGGFIINWGCKGIGFGEATFLNDKERGLIVETECMGREFLEALMKEFVKRTKIVEWKSKI